MYDFGVLNYSGIYVTNLQNINYYSNQDDFCQLIKIELTPSKYLSDKNRYKRLDNKLQ